jgi:two-component system sensor histidine kinase KdpD
MDLRIIRAGFRATSASDQMLAIGVSLALVAALTVALTALGRVVAVDNVSMIYLIPVLVAATRWGVIPAIVSAVCGIAVSAFFFYPPIYDFRVSKTEHVIDLILFILVAVVIAQLSARVQRSKMRAEADALREALIGSVSHELRTPLSSILGSASILAQSQEIAKDSRLSAVVGVLRDEAEHLDKNIQNLLDATRISRDGIRPHPEWADPADIVNAAIEHKARLASAHQLKVAVANDLPLVRIDPMLVEKALGQLIENAVKYSPPGSPIEISAGQADSEVRISVRDHGAGLAVDDYEKMWDRFYRSPRHQSSTPGSGLGLWIAKALVTACGGRVDASSPGVGRGATFAVYLPAENSNGLPIDKSDE